MDIERWWYRMRMRLRALSSGAGLDRELDEELRYHADRLAEANRERGLSPEAAKRGALVALGGIEQRKEECRDARGVTLIADLQQDVHYALRTLRRAPAFTTAAIATLGLGIGSTVAMFTVINGILLQPLPFPQPERLFLLSNAPRTPFMSGPALTDAHYLGFREANRAFQHLATFGTYKGNLTGAGDPAVIAVGAVTTEFFSALHVPPIAGRGFLPEDEPPGSRRIVVIGDVLWRSRFGSDPAIVGKTITLDGQPHDVVGVMPPGFDFPNRAQAWTPLVIRLDSRNSLMRPVVGRLKPGVTLTEARAQFDTFLQQIPSTGDQTSGDWRVGILPLKDLLVGDVRRPLQILAGAVAFVLLIACGNVANLLLARASGRQREMAVRAALGAGRSRLVRQLLTESTLLALAGGACGVFAAHWAVGGLLAVTPRRIPRLEGVAVDGTVVAFAVGVSLASGIVFGLAPAMQLARRRFAGSLLPGGRSVARGQERLRALVVAGEIALAVILLTGAGLLIKSFVRLRAVDPGFRPENTVALTVNLPESKYKSVDQIHAFHRDVHLGLASLPDAVAGGAVNWRPLGDMLMSGDFQVEGAAAPPDFNVDKPAVTQGYFKAMGIQLIRGRDFTADDDGRLPGVAIVSRSVARTIAASEEAAIGRRVTLESLPTPRDWLTVVGVVDDVRHWGPARGAHPAIYRPYLQVQRRFFLTHMAFVVRSNGDPARIIPSIRQVLRSVDKDQPPASIELMSNVLANATAEPAFQARLLGTFAILALVLAVVGTYGVIAYSVSLRTHEIGLRMALGARGSTVLWMVIRRTLTLAIVGIAIGILGGLLATRLLTTLLFEVTPTDPATFAVVALTILIAAFAAGLFPATRATRVDPLVALRHE